MGRFDQRLAMVLREFVTPNQTDYTPISTWVTPDDIYLWCGDGDNDKFTFIYDGQLHYVDPNDPETSDFDRKNPESLTHDNVVDKMNALGVSLPKRLNNDKHYLRDDQAIQGRTGIYRHKHYVSFWHGPRPLVFAKLLPGCLAELDRLDKLEHDTTLSTPYTGVTSIKDGLAAFRKGVPELGEEELKRADLMRQLHLMKPEQKKEAMRTLGLAPGGAKRPWQREAENTDLVKPGQKWWGLTSEDRRIR